MQVGHNLLTYAGLAQYYDFPIRGKVEAPIWLEISDCSYSETRFALTKNTRRK
jgi:hypothetical protein